MRPNIDQTSAQIIPFPARSRFAPDLTGVPIEARHGERSGLVCAAAFDSWYHAAAIAEEQGRPKS